MIMNKINRFDQLSFDDWSKKYADTFELEEQKCDECDGDGYIECKECGQQTSICDYCNKTGYIFVDKKTEFTLQQLYTKIFKKDCKKINRFEKR